MGAAEGLSTVEGEETFGRGQVRGRTCAQQRI